MGPTAGLEGHGKSHRLRDVIYIYIIYIYNIYIYIYSSTPRLHFISGKDPVPILQEAVWAPGSVWTGGKSRTRRNSIPDRPARSQSLYRLSYPAHTHTHTHTHTYGSTMVQEVSRLPLNSEAAEAWVQSWVSLFGICGTRWQLDTFASEYFIFPLSVSFQQCSIPVVVYTLLLPE